MIDLIIDAVIGLVILTIVLRAEDTIARKIGYVLIVIIIGLIGRLLWTEYKKVASGGVQWGDYFASFKDSPSRAIPLILTLVSIPIILLIVYNTSNKSRLDYIVYGGIPWYAIMLLTTTIFTTPAYYILPSFDDLFIRLNNLIGMATNVALLYFTLINIFVVLCVYKIVPDFGYIDMIMWIFILLIIWLYTIYLYNPTENI
jgi:hypothetical protein